MGSEFVFVVLDIMCLAEDVDEYSTTRCFGVFDDLNKARQAIEEPNFKNFKWIDETHYKYDGILFCHYGVIVSVPKNEFSIIDYVDFL